MGEGGFQVEMGAVFCDMETEPPHVLGRESVRHQEPVKVNVGNRESDK